MKIRLQEARLNHPGSSSDACKTVEVSVSCEPWENEVTEEDLALRGRKPSGTEKARAMKDLRRLRLGISS